MRKFLVVLVCIIASVHLFTKPVSANIAGELAVEIVGKLLVETIFGVHTVADTPESQDLRAYLEIMEGAHPNLYQYISKEELITALEQAKEELTQSPTKSTLYRHIWRINALIGDGHLGATPADSYPLTGFFPFPIFYAQGKWYVDHKKAGIPLGSQIISINGRSMEEAITSVSELIAADARSAVAKRKIIEQEFNLYYHLAFGSTDTFSFEFRAPKSTANGQVKLPGLALEDSAKNFESSVSRHQIVNNQDAGDATPIRSDTLLLTLNTFADQPEQLMPFLSGIFEYLNADGIPNLIIDIRRNSGGFRENAIETFRFLAKEPFRMRRSMRIARLKQPANNLINPPLDALPKLEQYIAETFGADGLVEGDTLTNDSFPPRPNPYRGKVYVLIGGGTFSAGAEFALLAANDPSITLVGEETGGAAHHNGDISLTYKLPNSGIQIYMSVVEVQAYTAVNLELGKQGIPPDVPAALTPDDVLAGRDAVLAKALELIDSRSTP